MENKGLTSAKKIFATFCAMLDKNGWNYEKDEDNLEIETGARGDDLPIDLTIIVEPEVELILLYSPLDFVMPKQRIAEAAIDLCIINNSMLQGTFDMDVSSGRMCYRMSMSFKESLISGEACAFFIGYAAHMVDEYNDKLLMVAKGLLSWQALLEDVEGE